MDGSEVTHACPSTGQDVAPCCGENVFDLPRADRISLRPELVTCSRAPLPEGICPCGATRRVNWSPAFNQWLCSECLDTRTRLELGEVTGAPRVRLWTDSMAALAETMATLQATVQVSASEITVLAHACQAVKKIRKRA